MKEDLPVLIDTAEKLASSILDLERYNLLALDTELDSYFSYQDQICLVQISTPDQDYLFDPLAIDLTPLAPIFTDQKRITIFHAGMNDIPHLKHEFNFNFSNIFDTYIAAGALNYPKRGLAVLIQQHFGVTLDKQYQRADWRQRPLPEEMMQYARYDTSYLFDLRLALLKELEQKNRLEEAQYAFAQTIATEFHPKECDHTGWAKIKGLNSLPRRCYGIVRELFEWREREAKRSNIQPFRIMPDHVLLQLAGSPPKSEHALRDMGIRYLDFFPNQATAIYNAILVGKRCGSIPLPKPKRSKRIILSMKEQQRLHQLKEWRAATVTRDDIAPEFLLTNSELFALSQAAPTTIDALHSSHILPPHVVRKYGQEILSVLNKL
ncbi:HRDC domain-containing protein [bacterium]|nr:HRDC domain-containing protein [bacterium]